MLTIKKSNDDGEYEIPLSMRLIQLGYYYKKDKEQNKLIAAGKYCTKLYVEKYGKKPIKKLCKVNGHNIPVNVYKNVDYDIMDISLKKYFPIKK